MAANATQESLEENARRACGAGDYDQGMTRLVEAYGAELLRFLVSRLGDVEAASEVYSDVVERLWRNLPRFDWRNGARGYCYAIARNSAVNYRKAAGHRPERNLALSRAGVSEVVERVRTATLPFLKTEVKDRFRDLRAQLSPDDQVLLTLRLDRALDWRELALAMSFDEDAAAPDEDELTREAARLRQRFKSAKEKLKAFAKREGLL